MMYVLQIALLILFPNVLCISDQAPEPATRSLSIEVAALKEQLREEALTLREEMYSLLRDNQSNLLLLQVIDLVKEVKDMQGLVKTQSEKIEKMESAGEKQGENMVELKSLVTKVDNKVDVMRSEVRLISQHKLTWQNSTWQNRLFSDYAVDGVYTLSEDWNGLNPISHQISSPKQRNNMLIIDLGGLFKIHTVKLWNRLNCCQDYNVGVFLYADNELLGGIAEVKNLYNIQANDQVYARKIYLKQSLPKLMNFREIQVFGSGPFNENEVNSF
jgi:hypothetical protein